MKTKFYSKTILLFSSIILSLVLVPSITQLSADTVINASNDNLNVILMIGDGMGFEHLQISEWVEHGTSGSFDFRNLTVSTSVTTYSADSTITDSAAAATAMSCGIKTDNGFLGLTPGLVSVENIVEFAQSLNKSTGLVSTVTATHGTPAAFYAHHTNRYEYDILEAQMIESGVDILMGGGSSYLDASQITELESKGYTILYNRNDLLDTTSNKLVGLFGTGYMELERLRNYTLTPSLAEMTGKAIDTLSANEDGFFLMVEPGQIDLEAHDEETANVVLETIAFADAIRVALDFAESRTDTIVIITADHETGGLVINGETLNSTLPAEKATEEEKRALRIARAGMISVSWTETYHTADNVPFYAYGDFFITMENGTVIDNTDIFDIMINYYDGLPIIISEYHFELLFALIPLVSVFMLFIRKKK
ncbi:MAG: alkaline phosphatase [Candidatus Heimdallarchaeaceae archaeon]